MFRWRFHKATQGFVEGHLRNVPSTSLFLFLWLCQWLTLQLAQRQYWFSHRRLRDYQGRITFVFKTHSPRCLQRTQPFSRYEEQGARSTTRKVRWWVSLKQRGPRSLYAIERSIPESQSQRCFRFVAGELRRLTVAAAHFSGFFSHFLQTI